MLLAALAGQMPLVVTPAAASCLAAAALCACGRVAQLERECSTLRAKLAQRPQGRASGSGRGQAGAAGADSEGQGGVEANGEPLDAHWLPLAELYEESVTLYPDGLAHRIRDWLRTH